MQLFEQQYIETQKRFDSFPNTPVIKNILEYYLSNSASIQSKAFELIFSFVSLEVPPHTRCAKSNSALFSRSRDITEKSIG